MRIEINLSDEVAEKIKNKAVAINHSRKSYIEYLCMQDIQVKQEVQKCRLFLANTTSLSSISKCIYCGKEKVEHEV
jgi:chorismate mutase